MKFSKKTLKFSEKNLRKMSHSAKKIKRGDPLASDGFVDYVKIVQNERGTLWKQKKIRKKSRTVPKKNRKNRKGGAL